MKDELGFLGVAFCARDGKFTATYRKRGERDYTIELADDPATAVHKAMNSDRLFKGPHVPGEDADLDDAMDLV